MFVWSDCEPQKNKGCIGTVFSVERTMPPDASFQFVRSRTSNNLTHIHDKTWWCVPTGSRTGSGGVTSKGTDTWRWMLAYITCEMEDKRQINGASGTCCCIDPLLPIWCKYGLQDILNRERNFAITSHPLLSKYVNSNMISEWMIINKLVSNKQILNNKSNYNTMKWTNCLV